MTSIPLRSVGARTPPSRLLPPPPSSTKEIGWWAMALLCASEAAFFAYLIFSYFYLGLRAHAWPPPGFEKPQLKLPMLMTATLLASSVTCWWGEHSLKHGRRDRLVAGLGATIALGIVFLYIQYREYH